MPETLWLDSRADRTQFQSALDARPAGSTVELAPRREYPGPVTLGQAMVLDGCGATLWALTGPVLTIRGDVRLRNLRIEVTGETHVPEATGAAIVVAPGGSLTLENVEVRGTVRGISGEEGAWSYPHGLALQTIAAGVPHHWRLTLLVPTVCKIESHVSGLKVFPDELCSGVNELDLQIEALPRDSLIDGYLLLTTAALRRRITVTAYADESPGAPRGQGEILWSAPVDVAAASGDVPGSMATPKPTSARVIPPRPRTVPRTPAPIPVPDQPRSTDRTLRLRRGQLPNTLFAGVDSTSADVDPAAPEPSQVEPRLGEVFLADEIRPSSTDDSHGASAQDTELADLGSNTFVGRETEPETLHSVADLARTGRKERRSIPTQTLFGGESAPPEQDSASDSEISSDKRRRRASIPHRLGDAFEPPET